MISITGAVSGSLSSVAFEPSRPRFNDADGNQVIASTVYARLQRAPGLTTVSVNLPDNTELIGVANPYVSLPARRVATNLADTPNTEDGQIGGWYTSTPTRYPLTVDSTAPISGRYSAVATSCPSLITQGANGTFEGGNITGFGGLADLAASTVQAHSGTGSMRATYGAGNATYAYVNLTNLVVGTVYTAECWFYVPAASIAAAPALVIEGGSNKTPRQPVTTPDKWVRSSVTFTATVASDYIYTPFCTGTPSAGMLCYVDDVKVYLAPNPYISAVTLYRHDDQTPFLITGGKTYTFAVDIRTELAARWQQTQINFFDAANALVGASGWVYHQGNGSVAGQVYRIVQTFAAPATAVKASWSVEVLAGAGNAVAGERAWFDNTMVCEGADGTYFDGSTPASEKYTYSWTGAPNASTSEKWINAGYNNNGQLVKHEPWVWLAYETSSTGRKRLFTIKSDPATYRYADLRPVSGGTQ